MKDKKLKILFIVSECLPYIKTGGLADVAGALPKILAKQGHDVRVIMPGYSAISKEKFGFKRTEKPFTVNHMGNDVFVGLLESDFTPNVKTYLVSQDDMFARNKIYGEHDDEHRFIIFSKAVMASMVHLNWFPDIAHCHDWHTGLLPVFIKEAAPFNKKYSKIKSVFTIHNLGYQGRFLAETIKHAGLSWDLFTPEKLEFYGQVNFMKGAILYSDKITTVSPTYAKEILKPEFGEGLDGVLRDRKLDLHGIINGIDYNEWGPINDLSIPVRYSYYRPKGKETCKKVLLENLHLDTNPKRPLFGLVSRLCKQKGIDVLVYALRDLLAHSDTIFIVQGTGEKEYEDMIKRLVKDFPNQVGYIEAYSETMARCIYAGSDAFLMPSAYEPCGLGQMIALTYGTIPFVHKTGGLSDTVFDIDFESEKTPNGFVFEPLWEEILKENLWRLYHKFKKNPKEWSNLKKNAMKCSFTWDDSVEEYLKVYFSALKSS